MTPTLETDGPVRVGRDTHSLLGPMGGSTHDPPPVTDAEPARRRRGRRPQLPGGTKLEVCGPDGAWRADVLASDPAGGRKVSDEDMLATVLRLRNEEHLSLREIASRLVIRTGKKGGRHLGPATVMRMPREHDAQKATMETAH